MGGFGPACAPGVNIVAVEQVARFALPGRTISRMASDPRTIDLICALSLFIGARTVVEAGTFEGHTALSVGSALEQIGLGSHVWTADTTDFYPSGIKEQAIDPLELTDTVTFFRGDFADMLHQVPGDIDLAYIDASSEERPRMRRDHFEAVWPRMRVGGLVLVDDCAGRWDGAKQFRQEATIYLPQHRGIALFRKA